VKYVYRYVFKHILATADKLTKKTDSNKGGLKSILVYARNNSSKKFVSWKDESALVQVSYFERDYLFERMIYSILHVS